MQVAARIPSRALPHARFSYIIPAWLCARSLFKRCLLFLMSIRERLKDPLWRLGHLYRVKAMGSGKVVPFRPRPEQWEIYRAIHERGLRALVILKARRLGMSTAIDVAAADFALWNEGRQVSIVDQTADDAKRKLDGIVRTAAAPLLERTGAWTTPDDSREALAFQARGCVKSVVCAGLRARGGTNHFLHVSEWGPIQAEDARRSEEILTGALPSAEGGLVVVETTWKGGRGGHLWESVVKPALEMPEADKTVKDFRLFFFPWWVDAGYSLEGRVEAIERETAAYLSDLEGRLGRTFSDGQKLWYAAERRRQGVFMLREFPSTLEECFRAPVEGAIYAPLLDRARAEGRVAAFPVDGSALVHTAWDLGAPRNTVTWYFQLIGGEVRVVDVDVDLDLTPVARVARLLSKGYALGCHVLPHDARATERSGRTYASRLEEAGLRNLCYVPRTRDVWVGIGAVQEMFGRFVFRVPACEPGLGALEAYHARLADGPSGSGGGGGGGSPGPLREEPVHDWSSHACDALRMIAEGMQAGLLPSGLGYGFGFGFGGAGGARGSRRGGRAVVRAGFRGMRG